MLSSIRLAIALVLLTASASTAQTVFATITGRVSDPERLPIPNVEISAKNNETGYVYTTKSNDRGIYSVSQLVPGTYTLHARYDGFKEFVGKKIELLSRDIKTLDVTLEVGTISTQVEVTGGAALIETETARVTQSATSVQLNSAPILQRRMQEFMPMIPTVTVQSGTMHFAGSLYNNQNYWTVDGSYIGDRPGTVLNFIEGVAEVQVNAGNATADQSGLAHVSVVTKSGTNELHGSAFDYYSNSNWSSRNPFASAGTGSITHNAGFSLGGPVYIPKVYDGRNKTFFFQTYEGEFGGRPRSAMNSTVPLAAWREGNFSGVAGVIKDPLTGKPFAGNQIPASRLNPVSTRIQDIFYPLPNYGNTEIFAAQNYRDVLTRPLPAKYMVTSRLDHRINDRHYVYGRYSYSYQGGGSQDGSLPTIGLWYRDLKNWSWSGTESWTIRPNLVNEFRYSLLYVDGPQYGTRNGLALVKELGLQGLAPNLPDIPGSPTVSFSNLALSQISQSAYHNPFDRGTTNQFQDNISWYRGSHSVKAGVSISLQTTDNQAASNNLFGSANFSNRFTNNAYADFLLGYPTTVSRSYERPTISRTRRAFDFYVSDNIKISRTLTADLGLRYEYHPFTTEKGQMSSMFDLDSGQIVVPDGGLRKVSRLFPASYVKIVEASSLGLDPSSILRSPKMNFSPRVGLAWRPLGNHTVLRGGFGVYYDVASAQVAAGGVPFVMDEPSYTNPIDNPIVLPRVFPDTVLGGPSSISLPKAYSGDLGMPYSLQYTVSLDHERWGNAFHISFIGTGLRQGLYDVNVNQPLPDATLFINKQRRFPNFPAIRYTSNGAGHQYNGLVLKADRRFRNGFSYEYSFTWSRDIGDMGTDIPSLIENSYDRARERASIYDIPIRRHTAQVIYELPVGRQRRFLPSIPRVLDGAIGGWQLASVLTTHSGQLLTPLWTGSDPTGTAFTTSKTPAQVTIRPDRIADGNLPESERSVSRWFGTEAFIAPRAGSFGTSGGGVLLGPPSFVLNGVLSKSFVIYERMKLHAALQSSNVLNHPNYSTPGLNISQVASAGRISGIGGSTDTDQSGRRSVRVMLRLEW